MKKTTEIDLLKYKCIVIGTSAGGMQALTKLFSSIPADFELPILVVQHMHKTQDNYHITHYEKLVSIPVKEAIDKEKINQGTIYFAPPDYHLLVEDDFTLSLSSDEKINYSRPAIDILFESAADAFRNKLIGIILTGANHDGTAGLRKIKQAGGLAIAQDPEDAEFPMMPQSAISQVNLDLIMSLDDLISQIFS